MIEPGDERTELVRIGMELWQVLTSLGVEPEELCLRCGEIAGGPPLPAIPPLRPLDPWELLMLNARGALN